MNGKAMLIYTHETGGEFHATVETEDNRYEDVVSRGYLTGWHFDGPNREVKLVARVVVDANHDFVLGRSRG